MTREKGTGTKERRFKNSVTVYFTDEENDKLRSTVKEEKISLNSYIRDAVNFKLNYKKKTKENDDEYNKLINEYKDNVEIEKYKLWVKLGGK